jgi:ubiquinone biosynthesis monooxygenase Coq7
MHQQFSWHDRLISIVDEGLRSVIASAPPRRRSPATAVEDTPLTAAERETISSLMRVNRAGEISAQALYLGQALFARRAATALHLREAADEEHDHLAWCTMRLVELGGRNSYLDPLWYAGSAIIGVLAGAAGDRASLGFVSETERQVEAHLDDHRSRLPERDLKSRAILDRMAADEARHGTMARLAGAQELPGPVRGLMLLGGGLLRRVALTL